MSLEAFYCFAQNIDWPAWVQAVGSVIAIAASVLISRRADRRADKEREDAYAVRLAVARQFATGIKESAEVLRMSGDFIGERDDWENAYATLREIYDQAGAFDCTSFKRPEVATAYLLLLARLRLVAGFTRYVASKGGDESKVKSVNSNCEMLEVTASKFLQVSLKD